LLVWASVRRTESFRMDHGGSAIGVDLRKRSSFPHFKLCLSRCLAST